MRPTLFQMKMLGIFHRILKSVMFNIFMLILGFGIGFSYVFMTLSVHTQIDNMISNHNHNYHGYAKCNTHKLYNKTNDVEISKQDLIKILNFINNLENNLEK